MISAGIDWIDNFIFRAMPGNASGEHTALMLFIGAYFTIIIGAAVTILMIHLNDPSGDGTRIKQLFGIVDRKEAEARELADLAKRRAADKAAWERSKEKGDLGYYQSHQKSGGYKDGLSQEDFKMGKPQKLSEEAQNKIDAIKRSAAKNPPKDSKLPANPGTKVLKYSWEDAKDSAKIYIDEVPGYDTWAEADIPKQNCSVYWDDRESLILLLTNTAGDKSWYLHIPRLFRDVNDINTIWKKKRLTIKIMKRKDEDWDSLDFKPVLPKTDEDAEREFYEDRNPDKPKTKFMDKSRMPFGDDMGDYVDKMGDIDIDSKAGPMGGLAGMFGF